VLSKRRQEREENCLSQSQELISKNSFSFAVLAVTGEKSFNIDPGNGFGHLESGGKK
jgi:hypothetical protein